MPLFKSKKKPQNTEQLRDRLDDLMLSVRNRVDDMKQGTTGPIRLGDLLSQFSESDTPSGRVKAEEIAVVPMVDALEAVEAPRDEIAALSAQVESYLAHMDEAAAANEPSMPDDAEEPDDVDVQTPRGRRARRRLDD